MKNSAASKLLNANKGPWPFSATHIIVTPTRTLEKARLRRLARLLLRWTYAYQRAVDAKVIVKPFQRATYLDSMDEIWGLISNGITSIEDCTEVWEVNAKTQKAWSKVVTKMLKANQGPWLSTRIIVRNTNPGSARNQTTPTP